MKPKKPNVSAPNRSRKTNAKGNLLLATKTISSLAIVLRQAGLSMSDIRSICDSATDAAQHAAAKPLYVTPNRDSALLGSALTIWHRDTTYVCAAGTPAPLPLYGRRRSVESLLRRVGFGRRTRETLRFLQGAGLIVRDGRGAFLPVGRAARMPDMNSHFVEHIALGMMKLVQTVHQNFTPKGKRKPLLQRAAAIKQLPDRYHAEFREFINEQGNAFVANVDDWLEARAVRRTTKQRNALPAGVYAFAFLG